MPTVSRTFDVDAAPQTVIDYLKDFANAEEWDPGTQRCVRSDAGPIAAGATWHNTSKILTVTAELDYTLTELAPQRLVFVGENASSTSIDTITVQPRGDGSVVTYRADLRMKGLAKLTAPAMKVLFERIANDTEKRLTEVLNGLPR
ncbi:MAG: SRPBCC family protein [Actinobacteria bacterium]|nr:SRPBCC family protein [Actinomycetota bacterium]